MNVTFYLFMIPITIYMHMYAYVYVSYKEKHVRVILVYLNPVTAVTTVMHSLTHIIM